jgi:ABC-type phosphate/phosphonate transport system substrate-binding protein
VNRGSVLIMGAVAYDPKVVQIWNGFRDYFHDRGFGFDYILYSNYERQVSAHLSGHIHVAWNSPLAWLMTEAGAERMGREARAICMRDTDRDLTSVVIVRADSPIRTLSELQGRRVGTGARDSPQATLIPLDFLAEAGLAPRSDFEVVGFDVAVGMHGDHIGGERKAVEAVLAGQVDAACLIDSNYLAFGRDGVLSPGATRILARTPAYDHCNFTVLDDAPSAPADRFRELLLEMSYGDARLRPLLDMEGLKQWVPGRTEGYAPLAHAAARFGTVAAFLEEMSL